MREPEPETRAAAATGGSVGEEVANAATHGTGALLASAALAILVTEAALPGTVWHVVAYSVVGASMVLLFSASTLCHSFSRTRAARTVELLDHSAIYVLIAGTYTLTITHISERQAHDALASHVTY